MKVAKIKASGQLSRYNSKPCGFPHTGCGQTLWNRDMERGLLAGNKIWTLFFENAVGRMAFFPAQSTAGIFHSDLSRISQAQFTGMGETAIIGPEMVPLMLKELA